jgi:hypothetical protein
MVIRLAWLPLLVVLSGCKLVDQESFGGAPRKPAPDALQAALGSDGAEPLAVIRPADNAPYDDVLSRAVAAETTRNPGARFLVVAETGPAPTLGKQQSALDSAAAAAEQVVDSMVADGVAAERISLSARTEPRLTATEIDVFAAH